MTALFKRLFDIERGEIARALLMFLYAFLLLSAYLILKPVRNSIFLDNFGADQLVYMYMLIAAVATPVAWFYGWTAARTSLPRLIGATTAIIVICLAAFWYLIGAQVSWLVYVFYVWVSLFGVFTTSQYWLLANHVFDAREAKRIFPFCAAGAIVGGMTGSLLTNLFAELLGTENLLWLCIAFLLMCFGILVLVWRMRPTEDTAAGRHQQKAASTKGMLPVILKSRHLSLLALMISLTVMVSTFVDFQFSKVVEQAFEDRDKLTAFFGLFFFSLSLISLILQLLFSSRIIRRFGIGTAILFLPIGLLLGSAAIFIAPVLASAALVKISDGSFRYSINKTGLELLYLPVATNIKDRVKAFMDVVGDRFARGLGGGLLFVVNDLLSWPVQWISFLSAALISGWIVVAVLIKREYSRTFRAALDTRLFDADTIRSRIQDAASIEALKRALDTGDRRQILFALELVSADPDPRLIPALTGLLTNVDPLVRCHALVRIAAGQDQTLALAIEPLLHDPDHEVVAEAIHALCRLSSDHGQTLLARLMIHQDQTLAPAACRCIVQHEMGATARALVDAGLIEKLISDTGEVGKKSRRHVSEALKYISTDDPLTRHVTGLLTDRDPVVRRNALLSAARLQKAELVPTIVRHLADPRHHGLATEALVQFGPSVLPVLAACLNDVTYPELARLRLPVTISRFKTPEAATLLIELIAQHRGLMRYSIIKGLNRLRRDNVTIPADHGSITRWMLAEAESHYRLTAYREALSSSGDTKLEPAARLLMQALDDRRRMHLNQVFRIAGLVYPADDMYFAYRGATSTSRVVRARAVEYLDTVWERDLKEPLFPILEGEPRLADVGRRLFHLKPYTRPETLKELLTGEDAWLAACAAFVIGQEHLVQFAELVIPLTRSQNGVLRESAQTALAALKE